MDIAAAVELFHNYSLAHDDVLDHHYLRRNRPTLVAKGGWPYSMLVGNVMVGDAISLIAASGLKEAAKALDYLGRRILNLNLGQFLDERKAWEEVDRPALMSHWWKVSELKLAVGIYAVEAAAIAVDRDDLVTLWYDFERDISLISQILNDTGDVFCFSGFYKIEKSNREMLEESTLKFTYPILWLADQKNLHPREIDLKAQDFRQQLVASGYLEHARHEIERLRELTRLTVAHMNLPASRHLDVLYDYIAGPKLPQELFNEA
jgi:geranylgeranyl pyrophosphate synthase